VNKIASVIGSLLVLSGLALLAYVGLSYARTLSGGRDTGSHAQQATGKRLAARLGGHQKVAIPRATRPVPAGEPALRMVIPKIGVDSRVVQTLPQGGIWTVADWTVGHLSTTPGPGLAGNGAYAAHDDIKGEIFKRLGELGPGDVIELYTAHTVYRYVVVGQQTVDPSDVAVLAPTRTSTITLVSCAPYWVDTNRLIVKAELKSSARA
jgi:LPXTG-site transpeptidase (sortase) family protein